MADKKTSKEEIKELEEKLENLKQEEKTEAPVEGGAGQASSGKNQYLIPLSIIVAGIFVAGAVYFSGGGAASPTQLAGDNQPAPSGEEANNGPTEVTLEEVTEEDHIRGDINAPVKIVEFSDLECPFCQRVHPTLKRVVDEYDGQVAWVYRHFPLDSIHPQATPAAQASECVAQIMGNDAFWEFADLLFENQSALSDQLYASLASDLGISTSVFNACYNSGKYADKVKDHAQQAQAAGGRGTPYSVVVAPNGKTFPINGAQPYSSIKATIDLALQEK